MGKGLSVESQGKFLQEIAAEVQLGEVREGGEGGYVGNLGKRREGVGRRSYSPYSQPLFFPCCQTNTDRLTVTCCEEQSFASEILHKVPTCEATSSTKQFLSIIVAMVS